MKSLCSIRRPLAAAVVGVALLAIASPSAHADETLRRAQKNLHDQGFYYGAIDGAPGDETTQAIRRFQIRNGLSVNGQLNDETLRALRLNPGEGQPSAPTPAPRPSPRRLNEPPPIISGRSESGADATPPPLTPPRQNALPPPAPPVRPDLRVAPRSDAPPQPPGLPPRSSAPPPGSVPASVGLQEFFARTPYEFAPPPVQADIVRRAQAALRREGFYNGDVDGSPGSQTAGALAEFQAATGLRRTGRLDDATLRNLRLLSPRSRQRPGPQPFFGDDQQVQPPRRRSSVYEGRVIN